MKKYELTNDDKIKMNIELIKSKLTESSIYDNSLDIREYKEKVSKNLFIAYKLLQQTLVLLGVDLK